MDEWGKDTVAIFQLFCHLFNGFEKGCKRMFNQKRRELSESDSEDSDGISDYSKTLTSRAVIDMLRNNGLELSDDEVKTIACLKQPNICCHEFMKVVITLLVKSEVKSSGKPLAELTFATFQLAVQGLRELFKANDADGNGFITIGEMQKFMSKMDGKKASKKEAKTAIQIADKDGDGQMDWREFRDIFIKDLLGDSDDSSDEEDIDSD